MRKIPKQPWPTKDAMTQVYEQHLWGGNTYDFYSGEGSHEPEFLSPYVEAVSTFLKSHKDIVSICDLGCGDFNVGKHFLPYVSNYYAIDIVANLIERNKNQFSFSNLEFQCIDISKHDLPKADCALIRQVLQHLSNKEIEGIVKKLRCYKYLIITEHIPTGEFEPNKDIISGQGIRLKINSGVNLLEGPFNLKIQEQLELCKIVLDNHKSQIVTTLYRL